MFLPRVLFLALALRLASSVSATLHLLSQETGAKCLDGSPPGVYVRDTKPGNGWIIAIDGGGWCFNESSCFDRSLSPLGSSLSWAPTRDGAGIESDDCASNPTLCDFNVALVPYCDGMSQLGRREDPIIFDNGTVRAELWARGLSNLEETLAFLLANTSLARAPAVLVDGCSAGGFSAYHHTDRIAAALPPGVPVRGVGDAGFFIDGATVTGDFYYRSLLQYYYPMHNASAGVQRACLADRPDEDAWQCALSPVALSYLQHPVFVINAQYDGYQLLNVFAPPWLPGIGPEWYGCSGNASACSPAQANALNSDWVPAFRGALAVSGVLGPSAGTPNGPHGLFLHSCFIHCQWGEMHTIAVGGRTMYEAFSRWWTWADGRAPGEQYQSVDCIGLHCNPSCAAI